MKEPYENQAKLKKPLLLRIFSFIALIIFSTSLIFSLIFFFMPDPWLKVSHWPVSPALLDKDGQLIHARLSAEEEWCLPIPLEKMGYWLPKVLISIEDKRFYRHHGVDFLALGRAIFQNLSQRKIVSGASTITSQLVRISDPRPRTGKSKLLEFMEALKLETKTSKNEILELYLNRAPFGGPIRGVQAASLLYFNKNAEDLSLGEASMLVGLLKGPTAYRPDRNPEKALERRQFIIGKIAEDTGFAPDMLQLALREKLPHYKINMPQKAWHLADYLFREAFGQKVEVFYTGEKNKTSKNLTEKSNKNLKKSAIISRERADQDSRGSDIHKKWVIKSSLDPLLQKELELALSWQIQGHDKELTGAGIIVENETGLVRAYVGNARFSPTKGRGWVDCAQAPRSPGSTLKPFIYARLMDEGKINPATLLADTPLSFGGLAPRNFTRSYLGPVSVRQALAASLNAPAVRVQRLLGLDKSLKTLRQLGFKHFYHDKRYGDSLILGAGEVTLWELAEAYLCLTRLGERKKISALAKEVDQGSIPRKGSSYKGYNDRIYSRAASWLIADILSDAGRLPFIVQMNEARHEAPIAYKTGTSFGYRDAWCAAYIPSHTVIIWLGKEDGSPHKDLVGISMAAPVAIKMARKLNEENPFALRWYPKPHGVENKKLCALSGENPSPWCPSLKNTEVIKDKFKTIPCAMHIFEKGRLSIKWPEELEDFSQGRILHLDLSRNISIVSPMPNTEYILTPGIENKGIPLKAEGVHYPVHWFVNDEYQGIQGDSTSQIFWKVKDGKHQISLLDAENRSFCAEVKVINLRQKKSPKLENLF